ncbi:APC family permease [Paenibacillus sp. GCM10023252]|uniref:APC family permease n=1 Tax=Paenibacillus sp. GCM10023252 TaxID=3252649 RepID=UPI00361C1E4F
MQDTGTTLKRSLSVWQLVVLGLGFMTPMVIFDTFGIASDMTGGHVTGAYILALIALLFTAGSYVFMIRAYPSAGSAYTYTQKSFNPHLGFMVGWLALMDYLFLPMVNALIAQIYLASIFPDVPTWIFIVLFVVVMTLINLLTVKGTANLNSTFVIFQLVMVAAFVVFAAWGIINGTVEGKLWYPEAIFTTGIDSSSLIAGATLLVFSYLGFDAVAGFSEETADPKRTIPRALFLTALLGGLMFMISSYFVQTLYPTAADFEDFTASTPEIAAKFGSVFFQVLFLAAGFAGTIASAVSSQASVSRLMYAMGRDRMMPSAWFSRINSRSRTPLFNIVLVGAISLTAILFSLETAASFINFGALIAFSFVNLSVISHYVVKNKQLHSALDYLRYLVVPIIGTAAMVIMWFSLDRNSWILGLVWLLLGFICLLYTTKLFKVKPAEFQLDSKTEEPTITM